MKNFEFFPLKKMFRVILAVVLFVIPACSTRDQPTEDNLPMLASTTSLATVTPIFLITNAIAPTTTSTKGLTTPTVIMPTATITVQASTTPTMFELSSFDEGEYIIVAVSQNGYNHTLYLVSVDSGEPILWEKNISGKEMDISSDGKRLALVKGTGAVSTNRLFIHNLSDHSEQEILSGRGCVGPSWSPDGRKIALSCENSIYVIDLDSGSRTLFAVGGYPFYYDFPQWSPDGKKIAYSTGPADILPLPEDGLYVTDTACLDTPQICLASAQGPLAKLTTEPTLTFGRVFAWSPDGRSIVVAGGPDGRRGLQVINIQTNNMQLVAKGIGPLGKMVWLLNGQIVYDYDGVYIIDPETGVSKLITDIGNRVVGRLLILHPLQIGYIYIIRESDAELNLRQIPVLDGNILMQLEPGEQVQILDGPIQAEGYMWWKVKLVADGTEGWIIQLPGRYKSVDS